MKELKISYQKNNIIVTIEEFFVFFRCIKNLGLTNDYYLQCSTKKISFSSIITMFETQKIIDFELWFEKMFQ